MTANAQSACDKCNKSSYSLLLLRPSPISKIATFDLVPLGANRLASADSFTQGLVPAAQPTESRYVLRFLREGYVYFYLTQRPAGFKSNWLIYRVADNGDVVPQTNPVFDQTPYKACSRKEHNAQGMKLVAIPQAHLLMGQTVWIAYSANLWNDTLKKQNAANPKAMVKVVLGGANANGFKPTEDALAQHVLECKVHRLGYPKGDYPPDFPFESQAGNVAALARNLKAAAACHPKTEGKEQAIVLADPAGVAAELNALRLYRYELAKAEMAKPENAYPMASLQMLDGLRHSAIDSNQARSMKTVSPIMGAGAFTDIMRVHPNPRSWPDGTTWEPLTDRKEILAHGYGMGRVIFPDQEERAAEWVERQTAATWQKYRQYIDEGAIDKWKSAFEQKMLVQHGQPEARFEADWWAATQDKKFKEYFALHFDEKHPNPRLAQPSQGLIYAQEVMRAMTPQPLVAGKSQEQYLAELELDIKKPEAVMPRSLVGNQFDLFDYVTGERKDKMHDLGSELFKGLKKHLDEADIKYGWLAHAGFFASSLTITQSWSAALGAVTAAAGKLASNSQIELLTQAMMVSETLAMARESAINHTWLKTPVRVSVTLPIKEAKALLQRRRDAATARVAAANGDAAAKAAEAELKNLPSNSQLKRQAGQRGGSVTLTLLSDNHELAALGHDPQKGIAAGTGKVGTGSKAPPAVTAATLAVTENEFARLVAARPAKIKQAADAMRELALFGKGATLSLEGHIGLLGAWINGWGLVENYEKFKESHSLLDFANMADSAMGTLTGTAQIAEAALSASLANRLGAEAAKKALPILGLRAVTAGAGTVSGVAVAVGQIIKAKQASDAGNTGAANFYRLSAASFAGLSATSGIEFVGAFSELMIALGSRRAIWYSASAAAEGIAQRVAVRTATRVVVEEGVAVTVGGEVILGLTGWGLIFLAGGLLFEVVAGIVTPTPLQTHVRSSYFGTGPEHYGSYAKEFDALDKLINGKTE